MNNTQFDANALLETYRNAFAPALQVQKAGLKTLERLARFQYALAGDYMEWSLTNAHAFLGAKNPSELVAKQAELGTKIGEQLRGRVQELTAIASESQGALSQVITEATAKATEMAKKAA